MIMAKERAIFAAGCFWGVEATFQQLQKANKGVLSTKVGYTGGKTKNPTYRDVCTDKTGHAEAVEIEYDSEKIKYEELVKVFFESHDPTTINRQGPDVGTQYRSAIFYTSQEQKKIAENLKEEYQQTRYKNQKIVTEITQATEFYPAEGYHQQYFDKNGFHPCVNFLPLPNMSIFKKK